MGILDPKQILTFIDEYDHHDHSWITNEHDFVKKPGNVEGMPLKLVAIQYGRRKRHRIARLLGRSTITGYIYVLEGHRQIFIKKPQVPMWVIRQGISLRMKRYHPKAVSIEEYSTRFLDRTTANDAWLERNSFKLV